MLYCQDIVLSVLFHFIFTVFLQFYLADSTSETLEIHFKISFFNFFFNSTLDLEKGKSPILSAKLQHACWQYIYMYNTVFNIILCTLSLYTRLSINTQRCQTRWRQDNLQAKITWPCFLMTRQRNTQPFLIRRFVSQNVKDCIKNITSFQNSKKSDRRNTDFRLRELAFAFVNQRNKQASVIYYKAHF